VREEDFALRKEEGGGGTVRLTRNLPQNDVVRWEPGDHRGRRGRLKKEGFAGGENALLQRKGSTVGEKQLLIEKRREGKTSNVGGISPLGRRV